MKNYLLLLMMFALLYPCFGQEKSNQVSSNSMTSQTLKKQKACNFLDMSVIEKLLNLDEASINTQDMSYGSDRSICYYFNSDGNRKLFIRMAWQGKKATEYKVLEKRFSKFLTSGENDIKKYDELSAKNGNQTLYGIGQDREGKYIHIIRKRFGSSAELQIELVKEYKDDEAQKALLKILHTQH